MSERDLPLQSCPKTSIYHHWKIIIPKTEKVLIWLFYEPLGWEMGALSITFWTSNKWMCLCWRIAKYKVWVNLQFCFLFDWFAFFVKSGKMVSRRKILSRSRDELHSDIYYMAENDDDDVWYNKDKLYAVRKELWSINKSLFIESISSSKYQM